VIADVIQALPSKGNGSALTELGKIKIGGLGDSRQKAGGGTFRMPRKDDHFTITGTRRNPAGDLEPDHSLMESLVAQGYGDRDGKLRQIPVRVLSDDLENILQTSLVWYGGRTVGARSDGRTVTWFCDPSLDGGSFGKRYLQPETSDWEPAMLEWIDPRGNKLFKPHTVFNCVIAAQDARWGGVYKFRTTSQVTLRQLYGSLLHITQLTGGVLVGMPLMLVVRPITVSPEGQATTVHVVHCELRGPDLKQIQQQALEQARFKLEFKEQLHRAQLQYQRLLIAPGTEPEEEAGEIADEFAPEAEPDVAPVAPAPAHYGLLDDAPPEGGNPEDFHGEDFQSADPSPAAPAPGPVAPAQPAVVVEPPPEPTPAKAPVRSRPPRAAKPVDPPASPPAPVEEHAGTLDVENLDQVVADVPKTTAVVEPDAAPPALEDEPAPGDVPALAQVVAGIDLHDLCQVKAKLQLYARRRKVADDVFEAGFKKLRVNITDFLDARRTRHVAPRRQVLYAAAAGNIDWESGKIIGVAEPVTKE
jgi:hypothetical protein